MPYRFQQHAARCLLPEERIISWVFRPAFKKGWLWRKKQENDALIIMTDRQLLWLTDTLPPGLTISDWGYRAASISLSNLTRVSLTGFYPKEKSHRKEDKDKDGPSNKPSGINRDRSGKLRLELSTLEGVEFDFEFQFGSGEKGEREAALIDLAETLKEFVPDQARAALLRLFSYQPPQLYKDKIEDKATFIRGNTPIESPGVAQKPLETEEPIPTFLREWLLASGRKLILPFALTHYYSRSYAAEVAPGFAALTIRVNPKQKGGLINTTPLDGLAEIPETGGLGETGESLILRTTGQDVSGQSYQNPVCLIEAEIVLSKGGRSQPLEGNEPVTVVGFPVKKIAGVEFTFSVLGCYLQLRMNKDYGRDPGSKENRWESMADQDGLVRFLFFSPEGEQFQKLFLALRQLLDIWVEPHHSVKAPYQVKT